MSFLASRRGIAALVAVVAAAAISGPARAGLSPLTIDPALSTITIDGTAFVEGLPPLGLDPQALFIGFGAPVTPGFSGGDIAEYTGTIMAKIDLGAGTIEFPGGSAADASVSGIWAPEAGGGPPGATIPTLTTGPGDYGLGLGGLVWAAIRNLVIDVTTGVQAIGGGGSFAGGQTLTLIGGDLDTTDTLGGAFVDPGTTSLVGLPLSNPGAGTITGTEAGVTVTIPISLVQTVDVGGTAVDLSFTGTIVATGPVVPEPSSMVLCGMGALGLVGLVARRRKS